MDKKLIGIMIAFFVMFGAFTILVTFNKQITRLTRADDENVPSASQTRVLAWPLYNVKADGKSWSTVTVIVRNDKTKPIPGKLVTLSSTHGTIAQPSLSTNAQGMAIFQITADTPGVAEINVLVDNSLQATQSVSVQFVE